MHTCVTGMAAGMDTYESCKRALLRALTGTVLEIGAGDGANFSDRPATRRPARGIYNPFLGGIAHV